MTDKNYIGLGTGIFLPEDISLILGLEKNKINNWLKNYWSENIVKNNKVKSINFLTMIEIYVFNTLLENGFARKKILETYKNLSNIFKTNYPFANKTLYYSSNNIFCEKNNLYFDSMKNYIISDFIIPFINKIVFSEITNLAEKFYPLGKQSNIVIDPQIQFGRPIIKGTRLTIDVIYELIQNNATIKDIQFNFDIEEDTIKEVYKFYNVA